MHHDVSPELEVHCGDMDRLEHRKVYLETSEANYLCSSDSSVFCVVLEKLQRTRGALEAATNKETELFIPQNYDATFDKALFRCTLGLDIRLTEGIHCSHFNSFSIFVVLCLSVCVYMWLQTD